MNFILSCMQIIKDKDPLMAIQWIWHYCYILLTEPEFEDTEYTYGEETESSNIYS